MVADRSVSGDADAALEGAENVPLLTVSRPALISNRTDRDFRQLVHRLLAFSERFELSFES